MNFPRLTILPVGQGSCNLIEVYDQDPGFDENDNQYKNAKLLYLAMVDCGYIPFDSNHVFKFIDEDDFIKYILRKMNKRRQSLDMEPYAYQFIEDYKIHNDYYMDKFLLTHQDIDHWNLFEKILLKFINENEFCFVKMTKECNFDKYYFSQSQLRGIRYNDNKKGIYYVYPNKITLGNNSNYYMETQLNKGNIKTYNAILNSTDNDGMTTEDFSDIFPTQICLNKDKDDIIDINQRAFIKGFDYINSCNTEFTNNIDLRIKNTIDLNIFKSINTNSRDFFNNIKKISKKYKDIKNLLNNIYPSYLNCLFIIFCLYCIKLSGFLPQLINSNKILNYLNLFFAIHNDFVYGMLKFEKSDYYEIENSITNEKDEEKYKNVIFKSYIGGINYGPISYSFAKLVKLFSVHHNKFKDHNDEMNKGSLYDDYWEIDLRCNLLENMIPTSGPSNKLIISDRSHTSQSVQHNASSAVTSWTFKEIPQFNFLLTGDATVHTMYKMLQNDETRNFAIMTAPHHGSDKSSSGYCISDYTLYAILNKFLLNNKPNYMAISCGVTSPFCHPGENSMLYYNYYTLPAVNNQLIWQFTNEKQEFFQTNKNVYNNFLVNENSVDDYCLFARNLVFTLNQGIVIMDSCKKFKHIKQITIEKDAKTAKNTRQVKKRRYNDDDDYKPDFF